MFEIVIVNNLVNHISNVSRNLNDVSETIFKSGENVTIVNKNVINSGDNLNDVGEIITSSENVGRGNSNFDISIVNFTRWWKFTLCGGNITNVR